MQIKDFLQFKDWYTKAHYSIKSKHGEDTLIYALIALTSPRKHVKANVKLAEAIYYNIQKGLHWSSNIKGLMPNVRKSINHYLETKEIRGLKTSNFYKNLMLDLNAVTIDTWQLKYHNINKLKLTPLQYDKLTKRIKANARRHNLKPAEYQAVTWNIIRTKNGFNPSPMEA